MNIHSTFNASGLAPQVKASDLPFDMIAANTKLSQTDKVKEASRQFEAVLLRQMLGEAHKAMSGSSDESQSSTTSIYNDMINDQLADTISRSGAFGLGRSLQSQLVSQTISKRPEDSAPKAITQKN